MRVCVSVSCMSCMYGTYLIVYTRRYRLSRDVTSNKQFSCTASSIEWNLIAIGARVHFWPHLEQRIFRYFLGQLFSFVMGFLKLLPLNDLKNMFFDIS